MKKEQLFNQQPLRRKNGRYCSKEQYRQEIIEEDNNENTNIC